MNWEERFCNDSWRVTILRCQLSSSLDAFVKIKLMCRMPWNPESMNIGMLRVLHLQKHGQELNFLCWSGGAPSFPESALTKFAEGTPSHNAVKDMKKQLLDEFPNSTVTPTARGQQQVSVRATGRPDYSIDGGKEPVDPSRLLDMEYVVASDFEQSVERLGMAL